MVEESFPHNSKEFCHKKHIKILLYAVIFVVFQIVVITLFVLTVMKFRAPKFRVSSASFATFNVDQLTPSFSMGMVTETGVKNTNFGQFRYDNTMVDFYYRGTKIGEGVVERGRAKWRSTRMFNVIVDLSSNNLSSNSQLSSDIQFWDFAFGYVVKIEREGDYNVFYGDK